MRTKLVDLETMVFREISRGKPASKRAIAALAKAMFMRGGRGSAHNLGVLGAEIPFPEYSTPS